MYTDGDANPDNNESVKANEANPLENGQSGNNQGNIRFENQKDVFNNLLNEIIIKSPYEIVSAIISYDSTRAISVCKKSDSEFYIMQYDLDTQEVTFEESIGGTELV